MPPRVILASQSQGRFRLLRQAGLDPEVIVSGFDEESITARDPAKLSRMLAEAKGRAVWQGVEGDAILIACDSVLEFEGRPWGKPETPEAAVRQWYRIRGREGVLHTGHLVIARRGTDESSALRVASTVVKFADLADDEIEAYAASGEPTWAAGAFTIDALGGAFVTGIVGDPHNVVGLSLPLVRQILLDLGIKWYTLWRPDATNP